LADYQRSHVAKLRDAAPSTPTTSKYQDMASDNP